MRGQTPGTPGERAQRLTPEEALPTAAEGLAAAAVASASRMPGATAEVGPASPMREVAAVAAAGAGAASPMREVVVAAAQQTNAPGSHRPP